MNTCAGKNSQFYRANLTTILGTSFEIQDTDRLGLVPLPRMTITSFEKADTLRLQPKRSHGVILSGGCVRSLKICHAPSRAHPTGKNFRQSRGSDGTYAGNFSQDWLFPCSFPSVRHALTTSQPTISRCQVFAMHDMPSDHVVSAGGHVFSIRLDGERVTVDGKAMSVSLEPIADNLYSLMVDHVSYDVALSSDGTGTIVNIEGQAIPVVVKDPKTLLLDKFGTRGRTQKAAQRLHAPMPGLVLEVGVQPGETVRAGQGMLVLEAMKMENELRAPSDGVICQVHVAAGEAVAKGAPLIEFSSGEPHATPEKQ